MKSIQLRRLVKWWALGCGSSLVAASSAVCIDSGSLTSTILSTVRVYFSTFFDAFFDQVF